MCTSTSEFAARLWSSRIEKKVKVIVKLKVRDKFFSHTSAYQMRQNVTKHLPTSTHHHSSQPNRALHPEEGKVKSLSPRLSRPPWTPSSHGIPKKKEKKWWLHHSTNTIVATTKVVWRREKKMFLSNLHSLHNHERQWKAIHGCLFLLTQF